MAVLFYKYREVLWSLLIGFLAGLYASAFHITNNMTMLTGPSIVLTLICFTILPLVLVAAVAFTLKVFGKSNYIAIASITVSLVYLLLVLRSALLEIDTVNTLLSLAGGNSGSAKDTILYIVYSIIPAVLVAFIFRDNSKKFVIILGAMIIAVFGMKVGSNASTPNGAPEAGNVWANWSKYKDIMLEKKPNIYLILPDAYGSLAYMQEGGIDLQDFRQFLTDRNFRLYEEVYASYQSTLNSLPAMLNMEHHYYTITTAKNPTEVNNSARLIAGGDHNFFHILKNNQYKTHNIHQGTYLLLHGSLADYTYPEIGAYVGAKTVLSRTFKCDLLTDEDKLGTNFGIEKVREEAVAHIPTDNSTPVVQYIHLWWPGHAPNKLMGKCDEQKEIGKYAERVKKINVILEKLLADIIDKDPDAVMIIVGDHGPFISNKCKRNGKLKTIQQLRDRAGVLCAIRWPTSYDGRYDSKIKTSVNLLRYVLASLAKNEPEILKTVVPDEVYVRMRGYRPGHKYFKIVEDGKMMAHPTSLKDS